LNHNDNGSMPASGLCASLGWPADLDLFRPEMSSLFQHWAGQDVYNLNELRETIVLFLAAMSGEL